MPDSPWTLQLLLLLAVLVLAVLLGALLLRRDHAESAREEVAEPEGAAPLPAVVANPSKIDDVPAARSWISGVCLAAGWQEPLWLETTREDPGGGQAREAVAAGATTVLAYGGDGTVRAVAAALAGTDVALGILPSGTGNLLARNLAIPMNDSTQYLRTALFGYERVIDIARAEVDVSGHDAEPVPQSFLVMAGIGFDADVMAAVEPRLKARVGWWAYVVAGARLLRGSATRMTLRLDDDPPLNLRARTVIVGNCGELTGGVRLLPEAEVDDGWLDVVAVAPRGLVGWAAVTAMVLTGRKGRDEVRHFRCRRVEVVTDRPEQVQLDGDPVGVGRALRVSVDAGALRVRVLPR